MNEYEFILKFALPDPAQDPGILVAQLTESGCDDALLGIGRKGRIALDFTRTAASAIEAVTSAIADTMRAIPGARLVEAVPDVVGLTDIAELAGCSRQNARKIMLGGQAFPLAVHDGNPELFHLADVLAWLRDARAYDIDAKLFDVAQTNRQVNLARQLRELPQGQISREILVAV